MEGQKQVPGQVGLKQVIEEDHVNLEQSQFGPQTKQLEGVREYKRKKQETLETESQKEQDQCQNRLGKYSERMITEIKGTEAGELPYKAWSEETEADNGLIKQVHNGNLSLNDTEQVSYHREETLNGLPGEDTVINEQETSVLATPKNSSHTGDWIMTRWQTMEIEDRESNDQEMREWFYPRKITET